MKIAIDIDGVLSDLMPVLNEFYNNRHGTNFRVEDYKHHDFEKTWGGSKENAVKIVEDFFQSPDFLKVRPMPYSPECVLRLSRNHDLFSVTSRPESVRSQTEQFLQKYFFGAISNVFYTGQYTLSASYISKAGICLEEKADVIVEDCLETAVDCAIKGIHALWFAPRNSINGQDHLTLPKNFVHVKNWFEIVEKLK